MSQVIEEKPTKFVRTINFSDGCSQKWHYNLDLFPNSPSMVEMFYPDGFFDEEDKIDESKIPKTQRKYFNPQTGKNVSYCRAKNLGLV